MGRAELEGSLSTLDIWLIVFGVFVAIGVVGESVAGFLHWRRSGQLQELQTAENLTQQKEITRLSGEADAARGEIAKANASVAEANERTAILERETISLRIQLEREQQKRAQRFLSDEQKEIMLGKLRGKIPAITLVIERDPEAEYFALHQLSIVFQEAGAVLHLQYMPPGDFMPLPTNGVAMYSAKIRSAETAALKGDPLYEALVAAKLFGGAVREPVIGVGPEAWRPGAPRLSPNEDVVYVGRKDTR